MARTMPSSNKEGYPKGPWLDNRPNVRLMVKYFASVTLLVFSLFFVAHVALAGSSSSGKGPIVSQSKLGARKWRSSALYSTAEEYFRAWNDHDVEKLESLLDPNCTLIDWDINVRGRKQVAEANGNIFSTFPKVHIDILEMHVSEGSQTVCTEIEVKFGDNDTKSAKVVDVIEFSKNMKVKSIRAYKR